MNFHSIDSLIHTKCVKSLSTGDNLPLFLQPCGEKYFPQTRNSNSVSYSSPSYPVNYITLSRLETKQALLACFFPVRVKILRAERFKVLFLGDDAYTGLAGVCIFLQAHEALETLCF